MFAGRALALLLLSGCTVASPMDPEVLASIPTRDDAGEVQHLVARICRPDSGAPAPVVVINHGSPRRDEDLPLLQPASCSSEPARWFLARGYVVVFALRRGYGGSSGELAEYRGPCGNPDYWRAGQEGARDIAAVVEYATALPYTIRSGTVVVGQSTGGWALMAYAGQADPSVAALVSMAGGHGHVAGREGTVCRPDALFATAARFGAAARQPMLWIYAANDRLFPPGFAVALRDAFDSGGGTAALRITPAYGNDGHQLLFAPGSAQLWGRLLDAYLSQPPKVASPASRARIAEAGSGWLSRKP